MRKTDIVGRITLDLVPIAKQSYIRRILVAFRDGDLTIHNFTTQIDGKNLLIRLVKLNGYIHVSFIEDANVDFRPIPENSLQLKGGET